MDPQYKINDSRFLNDFKNKTFSGYKKSEVINTLFKNIDKNKVENSCNWITECIISGYTLVIWNKILSYACRIIHINNPNIFSSYYEHQYFSKFIYIVKHLFII